MNRTNRGFTLIEILIVVAIIGILASIVLVGLNPSKKAANDARRLSDLKQVQNGLELFYQKCGYYPIPPARLTTPCIDFTTYAGTVAVPDPTDEPTTWANLIDSLTNSVAGIGNIPSDPVGGAFSYTYAPSMADGQGYVLKAHMESNPQALKSSYQGTPYGADFPSFNCIPTNGEYCIQF